jgi:hypothetical protein
MATFAPGRSSIVPPVLLGVAAACVILVSSARAAVETNQRTSYDALLRTCSGELVNVTADVHVLGRVQEDGAGVLHLGSTITTFFSGTTADGLRLVSPSHSTTQILGDLSAEQNHTETFDENIILQGEGSGPRDDYRAHAVYHFTFDANGELTSSKFDYESICA